MKKVKLYIAISMDGKIATTDGSVDWLDEIPHPKDTDYEYKAFMETIDITLMGHSTFKSVNLGELGDVYPGKENYVFTRDNSIKSTEYFQFVSENPVDFIRPRLMEDGRDVWVVGGGQLNTLFLDAGLIDEIWLSVMPVVLGEGIDLFAGGRELTSFKLVETKSYSSGVIMLKYKS